MNVTQERTLGILKRRHLVQQFVDEIKCFATAEIVTQWRSGKLKKILEKSS